MSRLRQGAVLDTGLWALMRASDWQLFTYMVHVHAIGTRVNYPFHHVPSCCSYRPKELQLLLPIPIHQIIGYGCNKARCPVEAPCLGWGWRAESCCIAILSCCDYKAPPLPQLALAARIVLYSFSLQQQYIHPSVKREPKANNSSTSYSIR